MAKVLPVLVFFVAIGLLGVTASEDKSAAELSLVLLDAVLAPYMEKIIRVKPTPVTTMKPTEPTTETTMVPTTPIPTTTDVPPTTVISSSTSSTTVKPPAQEPPKV